MPKISFDTSPALLIAAALAIYSVVTLILPSMLRWARTGSGFGEVVAAAAINSGSKDPTSESLDSATERESLTRHVEAVLTQYSAQRSTADSSARTAGAPSTGSKALHRRKSGSRSSN